MTSPSPAVMARFAVAVIVDMPPSSISMGSAATVTISILSVTITGNVTSATSRWTGWAGTRMKLPSRSR